ncbi:hypothetical protein [Aquimarina sp. SS2-1]|uniref:hypothetical protein n=1 Tax=Aquimarina besae TaxID=3342247 RepID=UPI0036710B6A
MGLAERRIVKEFEEKTFPKLQEEINTAANKTLEIEVDWKSLAIDGSSHLYEECWPQVYFEPLKIALEQITTDEMGKDAIAESLDKVIIKNENGISLASKWCSFENKTLVLDHKPTTNLNQSPDRAKAVQKLLEENL